jgi:hypothetical protein
VLPFQKVLCQMNQHQVSLLAFHVISVIKGLAPERNLSNIQDKNIVANNVALNKIVQLLLLPLPETPISFSLYISFNQYFSLAVFSIPYVIGGYNPCDSIFEGGLFLILLYHPQ